MNPLTDLAALFFAQTRAAEHERDRIYEAVIGIVTDNKDPQKLGRVKLKLPTITQEETTNWATVVNVGAGNQRGWFFIPELEDEVLVMFEHGDIGRPVVIGRLWNGKDKPPLSNSGDNGQRGIVSRSGSEILFDDKDGKIVIKDSQAGTITLDAKNKKITLEVKQGDACIRAKDDITIVAKEIEMSGKMEVSISSENDKLQAGSDGNINVKGMMVKVQGSQIGLNNGGASAPQKPQAQPAEVPDVDGNPSSQTAKDHSLTGGPAGGGAGAAPMRLQATSAPAPAGGTASSRADAATGTGKAGGEGPPPEKFVLWTKLDAINSGSLAGEEVSIIDPDTKKIVTQATIDADGNLFVEVPENKAYDIQIDGQVEDAPHTELAEDGEINSHLAVVLYDGSGHPLEAGVTVKITGDGVSLSVTTDEHGAISPPLPEGIYELEIKKQKFVAQTLRHVDMEHEGASPYTFQLSPEEDDDEPDYDKLEAARSDRATDREVV